MFDPSLSVLEEIQIFTKKDWLDRMYRKSESESTRDSAETALNVFGSFCIYLNKTETELINEYQLLSKTNEIRKLCLSLDRLVQFMNTDHPEIKLVDALHPYRKVGLKRKSPRTIRTYFGFIKSYLRICHGIKISIEDIKDYVQFPKIRKEPRRPVTLKTLKLILNTTSPLRRALYSVLISSGMRLGEALSLTKQDIHFNENPVRVTIRAETTKTKEGRETYISSEAFDKLKTIIEKTQDSKSIFTNIENKKKAVTNEDQLFDDLRKRLGLIEKYPNSCRFVLNIHCFRAYFHTIASDKHGSGYANALDGHGEYLPQYYRKSAEDRAKMYLELEPRLLVESIKPESEKTKDKIINDLQKKMEQLEHQLIIKGLLLN